MRIVWNLLWGIAWGIGMAAWFCLIALLIYAVAEVKGDTGAPTPLSLLMLAYTVAGVIGGAILGLLRPLARQWWGAMLVGVFVAFIAVLSVSVSLRGWFGEWAWLDWETSVVYACITGPLGGFLVWRRFVRGSGSTAPFSRDVYE